MSYQVLALKWRPRNFKEMVGQEHVLRALINALDNNRLHHAFLFTGTRGVGKTTISRILAKSLNCDQGVSSSPCGVCSSCREIDDGRFVDLIEVDAASRTKVEDTRELLENVQYAPTRGRYKVYLIDEVHMLSTHSFNALLKTLEEPPPHVKFLLATTDPQKLPVTILSRCLQFNLRRMDQELIANHLKFILEQEGINFEPGALQLIAHAADGSMRDGLSLLDQAIAYGGGRVPESEVRGMLGTIDRHHVFGLLNALAAQNGEQLIAAVEQLSAQAPDYQAVIGEVISTLQRIALIQLVPSAVPERDGDQGPLQALAQQFTPEDVQLYYQIALHTRRDLPLAPGPRSGLEMGLLRMLAFRPAELQPGSVTTPPAAAKPQATRQGPPPQPSPADAPPSATPTPVTAAPPSPQAAPPAGGDWAMIVKALKVSGLVQQLALHCTLTQQTEDTIQLLLAPSHQQFLSKGRQEQLQQALQDYHGKPLKLEISTGQSKQATPAQIQQKETQQQQQDAVQAIENDPNVQALQETFEATITPNSIQPKQ